MKIFKDPNHRVFISRFLALLWVSALFVLSFYGDPERVLLAQTEKSTPIGKVFTPHNQPIGSVDGDGKVYALHGNVIGSVDSSGIIYNVSKITIGKVGEEGKVYNQMGRQVCTVDHDGNVYNLSGTKIGSVTGTGGNIILIGASARLLLVGGK